MSTTYSTQEVRDLAWLCHSQPFLNPLGENLNLFSLPQTPPLDDWFKQLNRQPAALIEHIRQRASHRLGHYAECLLAFFLEHAPGYKLLSTQVQIHDGGKTLGEIDFIYEGPGQGLPTHLELAIKYYLCVGDPNDMGAYIGPRCVDRLEHKYRHLMRHQTQLLSHKSARSFVQHVAPLGYRRELLFTGVLFYPLHAPWSCHPAVNPQHRRGYWCRLQDLQSVAWDMVIWAILTKRDWIAPVHRLSSPPNQERLVADIQAHFSCEPSIALMLLCQSSKHTDHPIRIFVVPEAWPF
jgi:uncharacterized protein